MPGLAAGLPDSEPIAIVPIESSSLAAEIVPLPFATATTAPSDTTSAPVSAVADRQLSGDRNVRRIAARIGTADLDGPGAVGAVAEDRVSADIGSTSGVDRQRAVSGIADRQVGKGGEGRNGAVRVAAADAHRTAGPDACGDDRCAANRDVAAVADLGKGDALVGKGEAALCGQDRGVAERVGAADIHRSDILDVAGSIADHDGPCDRRIGT